MGVFQYHNYCGGHISQKKKHLKKLVIFLFCFTTPHCSSIKLLGTTYERPILVTLATFLSLVILCTLNDLILDGDSCWEYCFVSTVLYHYSIILL